MPLWGRAAETRRPDGLVRDTMAVAMVDALDYDFSKLEGDWRLQLKIAIRTYLLDAATRRFLERHPGGLVINLGAGLDTRFQRLDDGRVRWIDLDLPETIDLRRRFFEEGRRNQMIARSVFDREWVRQIPKPGTDTLLILEGLLPYFPEDEVRKLMCWLAEAFPGAEALLQATTPYLVRCNQRDARDRFRDAKLKWGIVDGRTMERWDQRLRFVEQWVYGDYLAHRWRGWWWWTTHFEALKKRYHNRILRLRFMGP